MTDSVKTWRRRGNRVRPAFGSLSLLLLSGALLFAVGCGQQAGPAVDTEGVVLPEWAPEHPSAAFLRAAKVLKPLPEDMHGDSSLTVAFYEMFGTLTDQQIATFLQRKQGKLPPDARDDTRALFKEKFGAKEVGGELVYSRNEVSVPIDSLTPAQREAFSRVKAAWSAEFEAQGENEDLLVKLYKMGAKEGLSNVDVAFTATGHMVSFQLRVTKKSGNTLGATILGTSFAQL